MKKIYFSFILFFAGLTVNQAQTLTQANNAPAIGDTYRTTDVSTVGVTPGAAGPAVTWDMSAISIGTNITVYTVVAVPSSSASSYPSASLAVQTGTTSNYQFYTPSATDLKFWGGSVTVSTVNVVMTYTGSSAAETTTYSMSYNNSITNPVSGTLSAFSQSGSFSGTCSAIADGFGTLALPTRTFTGVLRKKMTQNLSFTAGFITGTINQETYEYFAPSLIKPSLFTITSSTVVTGLGTSSQMLVTVNSDYLYAGINESLNEVVNLNVYPNPAKNNFSISLNNEKAEPVSYELINAIGQSVKKENLGNQQGKTIYNINVSEIPAGVYFVKVSEGNKVSTKKITIQ